ncbi:MAG TPA: hypothetical protein VN635_06195 [Conexibacter sp.]|nr:hypothetical protein [Conexibacter sp.]
MSHHGLMRMEDLSPEDFDDIDESTLEYHEARPVRGDQITTKLLVPLTHDEFLALDAIASRREDDSIIAAARDAIRAYIDARRDATRRAS